MNASPQRRSSATVRDDILHAVVDVLAADGYEKLQLREVARRARLSLRSIYAHFTSRDELVVTAMSMWMDEHAYRDLQPPPDADIYNGLLHVLVAVFEPWEQNPRMLEAFHRARTGPGGEALVQQGTAAIAPGIAAALSRADPDYVRDVELLLGNLFYAIFGRVADGELAVIDVLPTLERAVFRLTADNTSVTPGPQHTPQVGAARETRRHHS